MLLSHSKSLETKNDSGLKALTLFPDGWIYSLNRDVFSMIEKNYKFYA